VSVGGVATPFFGHIADLYGVHASLVGLVFVPLVAIAVLLVLPRERSQPVRLRQSEQVPAGCDD
jgi:hypothetical protein